MTKWCKLEQRSSSEVVPDIRNGMKIFSPVSGWMMACVRRVWHHSHAATRSAASMCGSAVNLWVMCNCWITYLLDLLGFPQLHRETITQRTHNQSLPLCFSFWHLVAATCLQCNLLGDILWVLASFCWTMVTNERPQYIELEACWAFLDIFSPWRLCVLCAGLCPLKPSLTVIGPNITRLTRGHQAELNSCV